MKIIIAVASAALILAILLDAFEMLSGQFSDTGLIIVIMQSLDTPYGSRIRSRIHALGNRVIVMERSGESFIPVLEQSDVFVRATRNDGGPSLSVLEALSLGRWCVASDAVPRPASCLMFKNRDAVDLARALSEALERAHRGEQQQPVTFPSAVDALIPLYRQFLS